MTEGKIDYWCSGEYHDKCEYDQCICECHKQDKEKEKNRL